MRAVAVKALRETPELMDLPKPTPGPGEILVHLQAAGVNPYDWKIVDGVAEGQMPHEFPLILGVDGAGTVEGLGEGAKGFAVGDGVFGQFFHAPVGRGTYAEYVTAPTTLALAQMPRGIYAAQAAAIPTSGMTALALDQMGLSKGQSLLILGASGGIGSFAVQLASNAGVLALAASRGPNRDFLHKLGAQRFFDSSLGSFHEDVKIGYPAGVDALLDLMHPTSDLEKFLPMVRSGGIVASTIGAVNEPALSAKGFRGMNINLDPKVELLDRLGKEFGTGRLRIPLEEKIPLAEANRAIAASRAGGLRGKTVLLI
jgi:NADPH:quinone reductase-like Zn-dependent oxidoreductase